MRRHAPLLLLLAVAGLALLLRLLDDHARNPFAHVPINDAQAYWVWADDIAHGRLVGHEPFFSAPLYPYVIGALRAAGGGLVAVGVLQILMQLATAALLARVATRLATPGAGLLAAALYLLATDPAFHATRLLNVSLACLLAAAAWERCLAFRERPAPARGALVGLLFGLAVLTQPALLLGLPLLAWWAWRAARQLAPAAALAGVALLPIALATAHNLAACGEPILVSAQSGVTFALGNGPGADGTYHPIEGISRDRVQQNPDARALVRDETDGSWAATDRAFWRLGLHWWAQAPGAAVKLVARRLWWFVSGRRYGDIYLPDLEAEAGYQRWAMSAPLPAAWLVLPGLAALVIALRRGRAGLPELLLVGAPLAAVLLFFYSPRYRAPALPLLAVYTALALGAVRAARGGERWALVLALIAAPAASLLNDAVGFDGLDKQRPGHARLLAQVLRDDGFARKDERLLQEAQVQFRRAADLGEPEALAGLGDLLRTLGRRPEALDVLREAAARNPGSAYVQRSLAIALAESRNYGPARAAFEISLALEPAVPETLSGLGNVLLAQGDAPAALARYDAALQLRPGYANAWANRASALIALKRLDDAVESTARAVELDPRLAPNVTAVLRKAGASEAQIARVAARVPAGG